MSLICWLPLNGDAENYGASLVAPVNHDATIDNTGKIGKCYSFNGNNYYISLAGQQLFNCFEGGSTPFSICMWVYHGDSRRAVLFGDYATTNGVGLNIELYTGHGVRFYWNGNPDYNTTLNVGASTWNHIAITYDGSTLTSYLNGVSKNTRSGALTALNKTAGEFRLGRDNRTTDTALNGKLNDVRIYNHCLSAAEVHEISQGLVLHYKLDDLTDGSQDSSGYNHRGIHAGNGTLVTDTPRYTKAFSFNGNINNRIYCNSTDMNFTNDFSYSLWLRANYTGTTGQYIFTVGRADSGGYGYGIQNNSDTNIVCRYGTSYWNIAVVKNEWTHIVFTKSGNTIKIYKNGDLITNTTFSGTAPTYSDGNGLGIGCFHYTGDIYPAHGAVSDFRIYCTALSEVDAKQLYNLGAKIDNKQNLHVYEGIESQSALQLTKRGQMKAGEFQEDTHTKFHKTNLVIKTNNLIEL